MDTEKTQPPEKVRVTITDSSGYENSYLIQRSQLDVTENLVAVTFDEEEIYFFAPQKLSILERH